MNYLKEPLVHFCVLGLCVFGWFALVSSEEINETVDGDRVEVSQHISDVLAQTFTATWKRSPTEGELAALIEDHITEEVLVREAYELGLERGDGVIRSRLRQKMTFLSTSAAQAAMPDDAELLSFFEENAAQYEVQGQVAFTQVFLGSNPAETEVEKALAKLSDGTPNTSVGVATLLPAQISLAPQQVIDGTFGRGFFEQLESVDINTWSGPYVSGYGTHLVRVSDKRDVTTPDLESIKDQVLVDWRREMSNQLSEAYVQKLREKYDIILPDSAAIQEQANQ
ncbi:peptidyl-prolyl cis-trans isomerase [Roseovarius sp. EL26]|uniref:peptidylprolyl isomerase n=1 Tax=Roseovarius sp. EL26 TaxID=2126672 RepID=UPI000EA1C5D2|nr:peptidylprolyl isomerase [Roseovarius sp. EL26]